MGGGERHPRRGPAGRIGTPHTTAAAPEVCNSTWGGVPDGNCQGSMISLMHGCGEPVSSSTCGMLLATSVGFSRKVLTARAARDGGDSGETHAKLEAGAAGFMGQKTELSPEEAQKRRVQARLGSALRDNATVIIAVGVALCLGRNA